MDQYRVSPKTQEVAVLYSKHVAGGFNPYPVALIKARGAKAWDVDGKEYIDFLSMFSVVNFGHSHPKIVQAAVEAAQSCAVVNMPFLSPSYAQLCEKLHQLFGYDRFVGLTSGAEAADAAIKIARKWGYLKKGIPEGQCFVLTTSACYHGVTLSTLSARSEHQKSSYYGPFMPQVGPISPAGKTIRYGVIDDIRDAFEADGARIAAIMVEPIQGSAGIIVPPKGYLKEIEVLCKKHNVLFIADEVQSGLGRAGANLAHLKETVRPDLVVLGKSLAGGMYPLSGVMGDDDILSLIDHYEIGSTMAATPIACAAALAALSVLVEENIVERANKMGKLLIETLEEANLPQIKGFMGSGLFWGVILRVSEKVTPKRLASLAAQRGLLVGPAGAERIRVCPPLTISEDEIRKGAQILIGALNDLETVGTLPAE